MERTKKLLAVVLALVLSISLLPATSASAASKKVKLNKKKVTIYVGKTVTLKVKNTKKKVKWSTSNKKVATVSKKGKVKGKKAGKATITAKVGKKKYKCKITVKKKVVKKPSKQPTTKPVEQPTTKPTEQTTTKPVEQPTSKSTEKDYSNEWRYGVTDGGVTLWGYVGNDNDVIIPSEIEGKPVTSIDSALFGDTDDAEPYNTITSITIPDSVTFIDNDAFAGCCMLKSKFINKSKLNAETAKYWRATLYDKEINGLGISDNKVIRAVSKEITEAIIPEGITSIDKIAFSGCTKLTNVVIPNSVTNIGFGAFASSAITEAIIPEGVEEIPWYAFGGCKNLKKVIIPKSVTHINGGAFEGSYILNSGFINYSELNTEEVGFWGATLYDKEINGMRIKDNTVVGVLDKNMTEIIIPEGITEVKAYVFLNCNKVTKIVLPESLNYVGDSAFRYCYVTKENFINNSSLIEVNSSGLRFYDKVVNDLYIADNTVIGAKDVSDNTYVIPEGITSIAQDAFGYCAVDSLTIPSSVTSIDRISDYRSYFKLVIKGTAGSYAETWAKESGYTFVAE